MFSRLFSLDYRSLGLFRIAIGGMTLYDFLIYRLPEWSTHYSDEGVLQSTIAREHFGRLTDLSIYFYSNYFGNEKIYILSLFIFSIIITSLYIVGWRTKSTNFLTWLLVISIQSRNDLILHGGDHILRILLFWSMFLPVGNSFSIDSLNKEKKTIKSESSLSTFSYFIQIFIIYFFAGILKTGPEWKSEYSALFYAIHYKILSHPHSLKLAEFPLLLKSLTWMIPKIETLTPFLLFSPYFIKHCRLIVIFLFCIFHIGIVIFLNLYSIPWFGIIWLIPFIPTEIWEMYKKSQDHITLNLFIITGLRNYTALFFCILIVGININPLLENPLDKNSAFFGLSDRLRLDQEWGFYAPSPFKDSGVYKIIGELKSGEKIFLNQGEKHNPEDRQMDAESVYDNPHWIAHSILIRQKGNAYALAAYGIYLCKKWKLKTLKIDFKYELLNFPEESKTKKQETLFSSSCL